MTRDDILRRINYAKNFSPQKVDYYKELLKEYDKINKIIKKPLRKRKK